MTAPVSAVRSVVARARRPVFGIGGQILNAATNVATAYIASFLLDPVAFGQFALAFALVTVLLAAGRGLIGSTMLVHLPAVDGPERAALVRSALTFTMLLGLVASLVLLLVEDGALLWFAPWVAVALLQDVGRYAFLARGASGSALLLDVAWAVAQAVTLGAWVLAGGRVTIVVLATAWGVGALAGVVLYIALAGARLAAPGRWFRTTRDVAGWFTGVAVVSQVELYLVLLFTGFFLGPAETGGLRAVQLLVYQPALVLLGSMSVLLTPVMVQARGSRAGLRRARRRILVAVSPIAAVLLLVALLRDPLMSLLFPQYAAFALLVVPIALQGILSAAGVPSQVLLRGLRRGATVFGTQVTRAVVVVSGAVGGMLLAGPLGLAWGLAAAASVTLLMNLLAAGRAAALVRELPEPVSTGTPPVEETG